MSNQAIWKYPLDRDLDKTTVEIPVGAKFLSMQMNNGIPHMWFLVDIDAKKETRVFDIFGTGWELEENLLTNCPFIGTFQAPSHIGILVFHVFEITGLKK